MKYCSRCVMPDTRPGLVLDAAGVCNACRWHESKSEIDWARRRQELSDIAEWAAQTSHGPWDCVLGVSGGKDSTWQAMYLRDVLKLNPLLVQYSCSEGTDLGRRNLENMVRLGFSLVSFHPSPEVARALSRKSFIEYGNIVKYSESCLFPIPYRVAMAYEIPLVFFGENPALECGDTNMKGSGWDATTIRFNNTLGGSSSKIWLGNGITEKDILPYSFPTDEEFKLWGGRGVFMGYYLNWSGFRNALYAIQNGLVCNDFSPEISGDIYRHNSLDFGFIPVNSMLKRTKLGFGHSTEFLSYDVRVGRVSRQEAIALVKAFDGRCDARFVRGYCEWIGITEREFWEITDRYYGKMWKRNTAGRYELSNPIWQQEPVVEEINIEAVLARLDTERLARELPPISIEPQPKEILWEQSARI